MSEKVHRIRYTHNERLYVYVGTLSVLCSRVFGYTLDCGHSWNHRIPLQPKTAKSLVKALNDSAYECRRYNDHYDIATDEDVANGVVSDCTGEEA